ncbi:MAG: hypothetical protein JWQ27_2562 [Ferruginibacter sp.]|nr:hypothetical protein [Ferruginibacter sp.]
MSDDEFKNIEVTGKIARAEMGGNSKNAHTGFVLQKKSQAIKLRRDGGNPFYDDYFENFEGKSVTVKGVDMEQYLLVTDISVKPISKKK